MSDLILKTDVKPLMDAIERYCGRYSQTNREKFVMQTARGILRTVVSVTPPGSLKKIEGAEYKHVSEGVEAKKDGENAIIADIFKVMKFAGSGKRNGPNHADPTEIMKQCRDKSTGRVKVSLISGGEDRRWRIERGQLNAFIAAQKKKVGFLASGWKATAAKLGAKLPKWIDRNNAPGSVSIVAGAGGIKITSENNTPFAGSIRGLSWRIGYAVNRQKGAIERQIKSFEERAQGEAKL
jgi:hypothetical protein